MVSRRAAIFWIKSYFSNAKFLSKRTVKCPIPRTTIGSGIDSFAAIRSPSDPKLVYNHVRLNTISECSHSKPPQKRSICSDPIVARIRHSTVWIIAGWTPGLQQRFTGADQARCDRRNSPYRVKCYAPLGQDDWKHFPRRFPGNYT